MVEREVRRCYLKDFSDVVAPFATALLSPADAKVSLGAAQVTKRDVSRAQKERDALLLVQAGLFAFQDPLG